MDYIDETMLCDPSGIRRRFFGYDRDEVDHRLTMLLQMVIDGKQVNKIQDGTIRTLEAQVNDYRESQSLVRELMAKAEDSAREIVARAEDQAKAVEQQAQTLLADAGAEAARLRAEADGYFEQKRGEIERQAKDALRAAAFAENFEKLMGKPKVGGAAGDLLGRHILLFLSELGELTKQLAVEEAGQG